MLQNNVIPFPARQLGSGTAAPSLSNPSVSESTAAPVFDLNRYLPKNTPARLVEESLGTHQIPHKIFEFMFKATATRVELAVFGCLLRYTLGFHRCSCEASHSFISTWTGFSIASVRRGLEALVRSGLIHCVQAGNFQESAIYELPIIRDYLKSAEITSPQATRSGSESKGVCHQGAEGSAGQTASTKHTPTPPVGTKKENTNIKKETLLSPANADSFLKSYFENLKPFQKKRAELKQFEFLNADYSIEEISLAAEFLCKNGLPGSGELCHSPMGFLARAMPSVLAVLQTRQEKDSKKELQAQQAAEREEAEAKKKAEDEQRWIEGKLRFEKEFPTPEAKEAYFDKFAKKHPFFSRGGVAFISAAISCWVSENNK